MKEWIRNIACSICRALSEPELEYVPNKQKVLTGAQVLQILRDRFPEGDIHISDAHSYFACSYDDIAYFLAQDETNRFEYKDQSYDCDDFAARLFGQFSVPGWSDLCIGKMWTEKHALNLMIDEDQKVWFIEPQSDTIKEELTDWQGSKNRFIEM